MTGGHFWKPGSEKPDSSVVFRGDEDVPFSASKSSRLGSLSLDRQRKELPIFKHRVAFLYLIETHSVTIVIGETGSGKTTQIPQYLVEAGWTSGGRLVACTQPRRIAVQTVATRVAEEMQVTVGAEVGYSIRFEEFITPGLTRIKFLTDGVLLREMMEDPLLSKYSVIMVDEAHERSIATDMLLGLLKKIQRRRPELRLIIASATMEATSIAAFFNTSKEKVRDDGRLKTVLNRKPGIISVEGRLHPVRLYYSEEPAASFIQAVVSTVLSIHSHEPPGDILAFLTGQDDVDTVVELLSQESEKLPMESEGLFVLPLYAGLPRSSQELVFHSTPRGKRKVIVATNIAETSVTLEGVTYVVDSGFSKQRFYNPITDVEALVVAPISRASANQRAGRAGRVRPGKCFRLYTQDAFCNSMLAESVPEVQRSNLISPVLQLKALGVDNIMGFDWLAPPPAEAMVRALELLHLIGALDAQATLTSPLGFQIAELPLEPTISKMLLSSVSLGCSEESLTIAAMLSVQSVWVSSKGKQMELDQCRDRFAVAEGDLISYLNIYEAFLRANKPAQWCHQNSINFQAMKKVADVRSQLRKLVQRLGFQIVSCDGYIEPVKKAITAGLFMNAAQLEPSGDSYKLLRGGQQVFIHPSSVLFRTTPPWVVFHSVLITERYYIRDLSVSDPNWLTEYAPTLFQRQRKRL